jgi:hypothetical protein
VSLGSPPESIEDINPKGLYQVIKFFERFHIELPFPPDDIFLQSFGIISRALTVSLLNLLKRFLLDLLSQKRLVKLTKSFKKGTCLEIEKSILSFDFNRNSNPIPRPSCSGQAQESIQHPLFQRCDG